MRICSVRGTAIECSPIVLLAFPAAFIFGAAEMFAPYRGAERGARRVLRHRGGEGSRAAYAGAQDRLHARAELRRPQAHPQPEVLYLGRAAISSLIFGLYFIVQEPNG